LITYQQLEAYNSHRKRKMQRQGMVVKSYTHARRFDDRWEVGQWRNRYTWNLGQSRTERPFEDWNWYVLYTSYPDRMVIPEGARPAPISMYKNTKTSAMGWWASFWSPTLRNIVTITGNGDLTIEHTPEGQYLRAYFEHPPYKKVWDKAAYLVQKRKRARAEKYIKLAIKLGATQKPEPGPGISAEDYVHLIESMVSDEAEPNPESMARLAQSIARHMGWWNRNNPTYERQLEAFKLLSAHLRDGSYKLLKIYTWEPCESGPERVEIV
jgi:hypothetical protein